LTFLKKKGLEYDQFPLDIDSWSFNIESGHFSFWPLARKWDIFL